MQYSFVARIGLTAFALYSLTLLAAAGEPGAETAHAFKLLIDSKMVLQQGGKEQVIQADTEVRYTWKRKGRERVVSFDQMSVRAVFDGKKTTDTTMTRAKVTNIAGDKKEEIAFEDAPEALKTLLQDTFETPICKLEVDATGKEIKRTILARAGAKTLLDTGAIANAVFFHPPYLRDKDKWETSSQVTMGNGGFATDVLLYQKNAGKNSNGFRVSGILENKRFKPANSPLTWEDARYEIQGAHTYDPAVQEWVSGKCVIGVRFKLVAADGVDFASAKGTMTLTFERLSAKK